MRESAVTMAVARITGTGWTNENGSKLLSGCFWRVRLLALGLECMYLVVELSNERLQVLQLIGGRHDGGWEGIWFGFMK